MDLFALQNIGWEVVAIIVAAFGISIPIIYIVFNSPPLKALGKVIEAFARRLAGRGKSDKALIARLEQVEKELTAIKRADSIARRVREVDSAQLKKDLAGVGNTVTILFSDIENFTRFVDRGDDVAYEILQIHNRIVRDQVANHEGTEVKNYGDGFMVSFPSARKAILCALDTHEMLKTYNFKHVDPIRVRIGINAGEPIREESDYIGRTVNLAARIADQARGGEIWTSEVVRNLVGPSKDFQFISRGLHELQGFSELQALCEITKIEAIESPERREIEERLIQLEEKIKNEVED
jgi:class 3 adenylate cyclase